MRPIASVSLLIYLTSICRQIEAKWNLAQLGFNSNSKQDFQDLLDEIRRHKNLRDSNDLSCESQFDVKESTILRTKDSLQNGAKFLKAVNLETAEDCRERCCHTYQDNSHCDLAVYRDAGNGEDSTCFLFSCIDVNSVDACETAKNPGFKVFRSKQHTEVAEQLLDVSLNPTTTTTRTVVTESSDDTNECSNEFTVQKAISINKEVSIKNGALFLKVSDGVMSRSACQSQCCNIKSTLSGRYCDTAVFLEKFHSNSNMKQQRCFLFSCTDDSGNFQCMTTPNANYVVAKRYVLARKSTVGHVINNATSTKAVATPTVSYDITESEPSTIPSKLTSPLPSTMSAVSTSTSTISTTTVAREDIVKKEHACSRLMWQCDNGDCIKVTEVCNGNHDCVDASDELGCDELEDSRSTSKFFKASTSKSVVVPQTTASTVSSTKATTAVVVTEEVVPHDSPGVIAERTEPQKGAVLPLALGLSVTVCVLLIVACRYQILKKKSRRRGKPLAMEESDYLINGMYL